MNAIPIAAPQPAVRGAVWPRAPLEFEARLVGQVRAPTALRRALARVAGRMVAARGWERLGFARPSDYAVEHAGISAREFRDLAAVDIALGGLPVLDAAFRAGEIGWTQLRLLCRVTTAEDQQEWLALAGRLSARELAREVRAVDRRAREPLGVDSEGDGEKRVGVVLRLTPRARVRWWSARQVANRVAGHALSHGAFAEVLAAEVLSSVPLDGACDAASASERHDEKVSDTGGPSPTPQRWGPPVSPFPPDLEISALEQGLEDCDAFELDRRLRRAVQLEMRGHARVASLLTDVVTWACTGTSASAASMRMPRSASVWRRVARGRSCASSAPRACAHRCARRSRRAASRGCRPTRSCRSCSSPRPGGIAKTGSRTRSASPCAGSATTWSARSHLESSRRRRSNRAQRRASPNSTPTATPRVSKRVPFHASKKRVNASSSSPRPRSRSCSARCWRPSSAGSNASAAVPAC